MKTYGVTPHYELIKNNRWGRVLSDHTLSTPITGYAATFENHFFRCRLMPDGALTIYALSEWDFASGPVINDTAMVAASLMHDAFCHLTDKGILPWSVRAQADNYFAKMLIDHSARGGLLGWRTAWAYLSTTWRWVAVKTYSNTIARWRRTQ